MGFQNRQFLSGSGTGIIRSFQESFEGRWQAGSFRWYRLQKPEIFVSRVDIASFVLEESSLRLLCKEQTCRPFTAGVVRARRIGALEGSMSDRIFLVPYDKDMYNYKHLNTTKLVETNETYFTWFLGVTHDVEKNLNLTMLWVEVRTFNQLINSDENGCA